MTWFSNNRIEKTSVYLLLSLFIQFSAIENRLVFFSRKSYDKFILSYNDWKKVGVPVLVSEQKSFFTELTELNIKANPPCFQYALARGR